MALLILYNGRDEVARLRLGTREVSIGRVSTSDIVVPSTKASRKHACVRRVGGAYVYEDSGSFNGSFLGDEQIEVRELNDGDAIALADHELVFYSDEGEAAAPAPRSRRPIRRASGVAGRADTDGDRDVLGDPALSATMLVSSSPDAAHALRTAIFDTSSREQASARLQALFEISQALDTTSDFTAVLAKIMDKAIAIMNAERGFLMLADSKTGELRVHVARDRHGDITGVERETVSRSVMHKVMTTRRPVRISGADGKLPSKSIIQHAITAALCAPMLTRDRVTGVIYVDQRLPGLSFTEQDLAFFSTFAVQAKSVIDSSRAYQELVESLFEASGDFIAVVDPAGRVTQANHAAAAALSASPSALVGRPIEELFAAGHRAVVGAIVRQALAAGVSHAREVALEPPSGAPVPMSVSGFALRDRAGSSTGACLIGRDQSEVVGLIRELSAANESLELRNGFIRKTFGRYLNDEVVHQLLASPEALELGGEKREVTILMSDVRGFTSIAEQLSASEVVDMLNNYLATMVEVIVRYRGTIDEIIGDAILVVFGAPIQRPDDAERALACAVEMQHAMAMVNAWNRARELPALEMGIAVNTGEVVVGNIGSDVRTKYAVVGRNVNLTARIEANAVGGEVLISDATARAAGPDVVLGRRMELAMKGVSGTLIVHALRGLGGDRGLLLPEPRDELEPLAAPIPVRFAVVEGKRVASTRIMGRIVRLGDKALEIAADVRPEPLTNIALQLASAPDSEAYAKVVEPGPGARGDAFTAHLTSLPPGLADELAALRARAPAESSMTESSMTESTAPGSRD